MEPDIGKSMRDTLLSPALSDLLNEYSETALDAVTDSNLIREIPILNTIYAIGKTYSSIRDYRFAKKMMLFIRSMQSLSQGEREELVRKLESDTSHAENVGEIIADLISKIDGNTKPLLVAEALKLYAKSEISSQELIRLNNAIDKFLLCDANFLEMLNDEYIMAPDSDNAAAHNLLNSGMAYEIKLYDGSKILPTKIGRLFLVLLNSIKAKI